MQRTPTWYSRRVVRIKYYGNLVMTSLPNQGLTSSPTAPTKAPHHPVAHAAYDGADSGRCTHLECILTYRIVLLVLVGEGRLHVASSRQRLRLIRQRVLVHARW